MARRYNYKRGRGKPGGDRPHRTCGDAHHPQGSLAHKRADAKRKGETRLGGPPTDPETFARLLPVPAPLAIRLRTRQPAAQRKGPRERAGGGKARGGHSAGGTAAALGRIAGADAPPPPPPLLRRTHTHTTHTRARLADGPPAAALGGMRRLRVWALQQRDGGEEEKEAAADAEHHPLRDPRCEHLPA